MAGGGAVIAAAAAAHERRLQAIVDAFRLAGATAPARAQPLDQLGLERTAEVEELVTKRLLVPVEGAGAWYLSESAYIARRDAGPSRAVRILLVAIALAVVLAGAAIAFSFRVG
jgi:hypothetical protein